MPKVTLFKQDGTESGDIELVESVFGIEPNTHVIHEAILMHNSAKRSGTHSVKTRSEVRGGGRKPWRQKGTGRARHGSSRSPIWVGGGVTFGPQTERNYKYKLPKKVRRLALKSALSAKVQEENFIVLDALELDAPRTKDMITILEALKVSEKALIVTSETNENVIRSANNLQKINVISAKNINASDLVAHDKVIFTKDAAEIIGEVLA